MLLTWHCSPRPILRAVLLALVVSFPAFPVAKEIVEMQRDMAILTVELRRLKSQLGERLAVLDEQNKQGLEMLNRLSQSLAVIERVITRQSESVQKPVSSMSVKVDTLVSEVSGLRDVVEALNSRFSKVQQEIGDIKDHLTTLPPPSGESSQAGGGTGVRDGFSAAAAETLFSSAMGDFHRGNYDLSKAQFGDYLRDYSRTVRAVEAQYYLGAIAYQGDDLEEAVRNFDLVLERYPVGTITPDAQYKKGLSLMNLNRLPEAIVELRNVVDRFPNSNIAPNAEAQIQALRGLTNASKPSPTARVAP